MCAGARQTDEDAELGGSLASVVESALRAHTISNHCGEAGYPLRGRSAAIATAVVARFLLDDEQLRRSNCASVHDSA